MISQQCFLCISAKASSFLWIEHYIIIVRIKKIKLRFLGNYYLFRKNLKKCFEVYIEKHIENHVKHFKLGFKNPYNLKKNIF